MILLLLIAIPLLGGTAAWLFGGKNSALPRWISLASLVLDAVLLISFYSDAAVQSDLGRGAWLADLDVPWIPQLGISLHLGMDGLSLALASLTLFLGIISIVCSWSEIRERTGFFHLNLLLILSGILGVFLSLDLFLFYFFWELMLVPMYFLISIWGHGNRAYASLKFFLFTQAGGLVMLISILALFFIHGMESGVYTFDYLQLLNTHLSQTASLLIMSGFLIAFIVKLPVVPFHTWLPDAHTEAPTAGSVILAGLLLKTGAYGILRFVLPLFPVAAAFISQTMNVLAVVGIIYGALLAFGQNDLKRLIACTSVSHMGFVLLGLFSGNRTGVAGAVMQMIAHGASTGALFVLAGLIQERTHTRDLDRMSGFWSVAPRLSGFGLVLALASLGLPGFANFIAEFMVLLGTYRIHPVITAVASSGLVLAAAYSLRIVQQVFHGERMQTETIADLSFRETGSLTLMIIVLLWLGLFPGHLFKTTEPAIHALQSGMAQTDSSLPAGDIR